MAQEPENRIPRGHVVTTLDNTGHATAQATFYVDVEEEYGPATRLIEEAELDAAELLQVDAVIFPMVQKAASSKGYVIGDDGAASNQPTVVPDHFTISLLESGHTNPSAGIVFLASRPGRPGSFRLDIETADSDADGNATTWFDAQGAATLDGVYRAHLANSLEKNGLSLAEGPAAPPVPGQPDPPRRRWWQRGN